MCPDCKEWHDPVDFSKWNPSYCTGCANRRHNLYQARKRLRRHLAQRPIRVNDLKYEFPEWSLSARQHYVRKQDEAEIEELRAMFPEHLDLLTNEKLHYSPDFDPAFDMSEEGHEYQPEMLGPPEP